MAMRRPLKPLSGVPLRLNSHTLTRLLRFHPREVTQLAIDLLDHNVVAAGKPEVRKSVYSLLVLSHVHFGDTDAEARLTSLLAGVSANSEALCATLQKIRGAAVYDEQQYPLSAAAVRGRAISWYALVAQRCRETYQSVVEQHAGQAALPESAQDELKGPGQTLSTVAAELDFSVPDPEKGKGAPLPDSALLRLLDEAAELLALLADVDFPAVHSHFVRLLKKLLHVDPKRVVALLARSLRKEQGSIDLRHYESMILGDVLDIVHALLADHRDLVEADDQVRSDLVHLLDGFVRVGWPSSSFAFSVGQT